MGDILANFVQTILKLEQNFFKISSVFKLIFNAYDIKI